VRGVAILAVISVHSWDATWSAVPSNISESSVVFQGASLLRYGVELFFALSGWLIFSLYYRQDSVTSRSYWVKRIARIWPLWALFSFATVAAISFTPLEFPLLWPDGGTPPSPIIALLLILPFLGWLNPFTWQVPPGGWSIQVEMGHYLLFWPLRRATPVLLVGTILVGYASFFLARSLATGSPDEWDTSLARDWLRLGLFGTWPFFIAGGLAYLWSLHGFTPRLARVIPSKPRRYALLAGVALIVGLCFVVPVPLGKSYEAAVTTLVLLGVALAARAWRPMTSLLASLGRYSYFMYFAHFWVIAVIIGIFTHDDSLPYVSVTVLVALACILTVISTIASWAVGRLSWRFLEAPSLTLARRLAHRSARPAP
jgi:peptidoglycan/LPS O-acetylase OafA/YrhL